MSVQRWTAYVEDDDGNDVFVCVSPDARGEWIRYSDHQAEVERLQARERELEAALREVVEHAEDMNSYDAGRVAHAALAAVEKRPTKGDQEWIDRANASRWLAAVSAEKEDS